MNQMDRDRFEDLMEAYALNAVPEDERREVEAYLGSHPEAQAEIEELQSIAGLLALSAENRQPPPELRERLMRAVETEAGPVLATLNSGRGETERPTILDRVRDFFAFRNVAWGLAAVLLVGLFSWNALLRTELSELQGADSRQMQTMQFSGAAVPDDASAEVLAFPDREAVLVAEDLPELEPGETLQIWVIDEEEVPHPAGIFEPRDGVVSVPVTRSLEGAKAIAVTIEPDGGSKKPTSDPMMTAEV
jgi:anti-sigma-K factor RskA